MDHLTLQLQNIYYNTFEVQLLTVLLLEVQKHNNHFSKLSQTLIGEWATAGNLFQVFST